jgi:prophage regulatory protein
MSDQLHERFIRIRTVLEMTGLSRSDLYRQIEREHFPRQFKISERCVAWRESAVREWMKNSTLCDNTNTQSD